MGENQKKRRTMSELCATDRGANVAAGFARHRAGRGWRRSRQGAAQIVFGIAMVARKIRAAEAQDFHDLSRGCVLGEQFAGQPEIDHAPIRRGKALANAPTLDPTLVHRNSAFARDRGAWYTRAPLFWRLSRRRPNRSNWRHDRGCFGTKLLEPLVSGIERQLCGGGEDGLSMDDLDRRRDTGERAYRRLEIAEAGQTAQVAPISAGPIAAIAFGQDSAQSRGQCRFQWGSADADPSLEVAGTGLEHDTGLMPVYAHVLEYVRGGVIQVKEDVARITAFGVGPEVNVEAEAVVRAQKTHHVVARQLLRGPQTLSRSWSTSDGMDQADEIGLIRHRCQLATDGLLGEKFAIEHEPSLSLAQVIRQ